MLINHDLWMTLTYFMTRSTWVAHAFEWGKLLKYHLKGKVAKMGKWVNRLYLTLSTARGNINVNCHNKISSSLKSFGKSKLFYRKHLYKGGINVLMHKTRSHDKRLPPCPYIKNHSKIFCSGTDEQISRKFGL